MNRKRKHKKPKVNCPKCGNDIVVITWDAVRDGNKGTVYRNFNCECGFYYGDSWSCVDLYIKKGGNDG